MRLDELRKIAKARINSDDDSVRAVDFLLNMSNELAFQKMVDKKIDALLDVVEAAWKVVLDKDNASAHMKMRDALLRLQD